jgi:phosphopantetheine adenylyltransferase
MESKNAVKKYALFIGRYQSLHEGHKYLFRNKINEGIPVLVAIRDVPTDQKNPFTANQVMTMFFTDSETSEWMDKGMMLVQIIPDIEGVYYGRDVGYKVEQLSVPPEIAEISATKIREQLKQLHNGSIG